MLVLDSVILVVSSILMGPSVWVDTVCMVVAALSAIVVV